MRRLPEPRLFSGQSKVAKTGRLIISEVGRAMRKEIDHGSISRKAQPQQNISQDKRMAGSPRQTPPIRTVTRSGARVAPQQCPILPVGGATITTSHTMFKPVPAFVSGNDRSSVFRFSGPCGWGDVVFCILPSSVVDRVARVSKKFFRSARCVEAFITISAGFCRLRSW